MIVGKEYIAICGDAGDGAELFDVAELVRCRDCKHYRTNIPQVGGTYNGCGIWLDNGNEIEVEPNQFCSYGGKKDDE